MLKNKRLEDTYRHQGMRKQLIRELEGKGIRDKAVLEAMGRIPRHFFLDDAFDKIAYEDRAFPIEDGQTISQPYTVAFMTELLQVKPGQRILEVGSGSGYQASVLAEMGAQVYSTERIEKLYVNLVKGFPLKSRFGDKIRFILKDGFIGAPGLAPFDRIIVTAGSPHLPENLITQLSPGGIMVLPLGQVGEGPQIMTRVTKSEDGAISTEQFGEFLFVPMLSGLQGK